MFPEKKQKLGESPWMEVVSLSGTIWSPEAYFTKWVNGKPKSVNHEMRETLGFLSHSVSYKKSNLKKVVTLAGFINKCSSDSWPQPGWRQDLFNKSRISLCLCSKTLSPLLAARYVCRVHLINTFKWICYVLVFHFKLFPKPHFASAIVPK